MSAGALRLHGYQFELVRHSAQLGKRTGIHLVHQTASMHLHGGLGNADIARNLFAKAAVRDLNHDLALPGAQRLEASPEGGQSFFILTPAAIAREAELNGVEKLLIT